jgi:hypothetical protein
VGFFKDRQIDEGELRFSSPPAFVCDRHVDDDVLEASIHEEPSATHCDFCQRQGEEPFAPDADVVLTQIAYALHQNWTDPQNGLFHDSESDTGFAGRRQ